MATEQDVITQATIQTVIEAAKATMQEVMAARAEACTRHKNEAVSMRLSIGRLPH